MPSVREVLSKRSSGRHLETPQSSPSRRNLLPSRHCTRVCMRAHQTCQAVMAEAAAPRQRPPCFPHQHRPSLPGQANKEAYVYGTRDHSRHTCCEHTAPDRDAGAKDSLDRAVGNADARRGQEERCQERRKAHTQSSSVQAHIYIYCHGCHDVDTTSTSHLPGSWLQHTQSQQETQGGLLCSCIVVPSTTLSWQCRLSFSTIVR